MYPLLNAAVPTEVENEKNELVVAVLNDHFARTAATRFNGLALSFLDRFAPAHALVALARRVSAATVKAHFDGAVFFAVLATGFYRFGARRIA